MSTNPIRVAAQPYQPREWDPELLRAARDWANVERSDAPSGSDTRLTFTLIYSVLDDAVRRAEARGAA